MPRCPYSCRREHVRKDEYEMKKPKKTKTVELVKSTYQPTKAEKESVEHNLVREVPERATLEQLTKALVQPITVR